jgi:penicillin-binding protein 2
VPGKTIELTLDLDVQLRAEEVFGSESGAAVVMDCPQRRHSVPVFGPELRRQLASSRGLTGAEYRALAQYDHKPLFNKALTATYPPGSTFKTMVALAALENGYDPKTVHVCSGHWVFGRVWKCDKVARRPRPAQRHRHLVRHLFLPVRARASARTRSPPRPASSASARSSTSASRARSRGWCPTPPTRRELPKDPKWHPGETPSMGIGQGYTNLNPLQLCVMASRIANGQKALHPRLIRSIGGVEQKSGAAWGDLPVDKGTSPSSANAMAAVTTVGHRRGFGDLGLGAIRMAGKTGTAQAYSYGTGRGVHGTRGAWNLRDHAWFVGFAPQDSPATRISVLVEHGGFGAQAQRRGAQEIMRTVLLKDPDIRSRSSGRRPCRTCRPTSRTDDGVPDAPTDPRPAAPAGTPA